MSRMPIPCVAIDEKGEIAMAFEGIKFAASFAGLSKTMTWQAVHKKKIVAGYLWMLRDEYDSLTKTDIKKLAWGKKKRKRAASQGEETAGR